MSEMCVECGVCLQVEVEVVSEMCIECGVCS